MTAYSDRDDEPLRIGDTVSIDDYTTAVIHDLMTEADGTQYCYVMTRERPYYSERRDGPNGWRELELRCDSVNKVVG